MKKSIRSIIIACGIIMTMALAFGNTKNNAKIDLAQNVSNYCENGQCNYYIEKSDGTSRRCRNCCQEGSSYCWSHNHQ